MQSKKYPWIVVGLLWVVALLNYLDRQMLSTMRPSMQMDIAELQSATNFGYLMSIFLWIYGFMSPVSGIIADKVNKKWLIVISLLVWSAVTLAMGYATSFNQLYWLRAAMGVSEAFYIPAGLALIADYHKDATRSLAVGIHMSGIYMGQALGGFGATIAANFSWQSTFHSFGWIGIGYSIILILFLKEYKEDKIQRAAPFAFSFASLFAGLSVLLSNISFWIIIMYFAVPSLPGWIVKNWLPTLFSENLGIEMATAGPITTITIAGASLIGVLIGGYTSDKWLQINIRGRIYTSAIGLALTIPSLLLIGYGHSLVAVISAAFCFGLGFGIFDCNNMPILCQFVSSRHRATAYGLLNLAGITAGAFITNIFGKSIDAGNPVKNFIYLAGVLVLALFIQLMYLKPKVKDFTE